MYSQRLLLALNIGILNPIHHQSLLDRLNEHPNRLFNQIPRKHHLPHVAQGGTLCIGRRRLYQAHSERG
ncbi:hypothetical protein BDV59DRAFT_166397 [Aspergillus ambiguus]|uniref:uncharacterized protein n=1 Tax=Aspergillus ambiguus TaxID=176160 RepID=UPI003CCDB495